MTKLYRQPLSPKKRLRNWLAVSAGRLASLFLRSIGRGATAFPGKLAFTLAPTLLSDLTAGRQVFLVTGTNGKTTTVRLLCSILERQGHLVITNPSGANLDSGLVTTLLQNLKILKEDGAQKQKVSLVFEIDEAYFARLAASMRPEICIVTNFFQDQLDRFGDLSHIRDLVAKGLHESGAKAVLCADDPLCAALIKDGSQPVYYFGMKPDGLPHRAKETAVESVSCPVCGASCRYEHISYAHLGIYSCPACGYRRPEPDLAFSIVSTSERKTVIEFCYDKKSIRVHFPVPGIYNAYNAAAALLAAIAAGLPLESSAKVLEQSEAAFGRMERWSAEGKDICLILVKNPVGMDQALEFIMNAPDLGSVMMMLNASESDGRDVSWIWDVHFESCLPPGRIGLSGARCHDLALRLYYAGKPKSELLVSDDFIRLFDQMLAECPPGRCLYLLPNYTAMLSIRGYLSKRYHLSAFWQ